MQSFLTEARGYYEVYLQALDSIVQESLAGHRLLRLRIVLCNLAQSPSELRARARELEAYLDSIGAGYQAPERGQARLYALIWKFRPSLTSTASAAALYPFVSEELSHPGGIFLGFNLRTGAPVVFNPYEMENYNFVIIGETGSGKSMTGKVYIRRWWLRYKAPVYVLDPSGEYAKVASLLAPGLRVHVVNPEAGGLDPVRLSKLGLVDMASVFEALSDVYGLSSRGERLKLLEALRTSQSMEEVAASALEEAQLDEGLFRGEPPALDGRGIIFDLSMLGDERRKVLAGAVLAALLRPRLRSRALLVVDEGWMWAGYPSVMRLLSETARVGRKYGVNFLFLTQRPADVLRSEAGRTILEQSATVLLLRLNEASLEAIRGVYRLTEGEERTLIEARPGEGVLRAGPWRLSVYVKPSREELRAFSTRPGEW